LDEETSKKTCHFWLSKRDLAQHEWHGLLRKLKNQDFFLFTLLCLEVDLKAQQSLTPAVDWLDSLIGSAGGVWL
jgi:hypothetical protein